MAQVVIFGTGDIAQIAAYYFGIDSPHEVVAFTVDRDYLLAETYEGKPLVPFEEVEAMYPPSEYQMFIALSYSDMNRLRERKFYEAKKKGYHLVSYVSSKCSYLSPYKPGENCFIFEDNTIQPFVRIEDNVVLWSGNHIGHHSTIKSHNFISSHVVVSGHCVIEPHCFIGVNATLGHGVRVGEGCLIGAGAILTKDAEPWSVYVPARSVRLEGRKSTDFKL